MSRSLRCLSALSLLLLAACGSPPEAPEETAESHPAAAEAPARQPGRIVGRALLAGDRGRRAIDMSADQRCVELHDHPVPHREVMVDEQGRLENVLVYLAEGMPPGSYPPPESARLLDQVGCVFTPRVQGVRAGQSLVVRNSDPTLHNVQATPRHNPAFNFGQPFAGMETALTLDNPEVAIRVRCNVHPWMAAYLAVLDHPFFATTAADGAFAIDEVPPGTYLLEAWHETLGSQTHEVSVSEGGVAHLDLRFAGQ